MHAIEVQRCLDRAKEHANWISLIGAGLETVPPQINATNYGLLTYLYLGHNSLTELPDGLFHLFNLRGLYVQSNKLERIPPLIGQLTDLQELYASNNDIAAITANITTLERLDCLWLDDNPRLPRKLQQNVSRNRARVQRLLLDIAEFYGPAMLNVKRAVWYWLCSCEFGEELPSLLPREVAYHIATFVWKTRGDDSWRF